MESLSGSRQTAHPYTRPSSAPQRYQGKMHRAQSPMRAGEPSLVLPSPTTAAPTPTQHCPSELATRPIIATLAPVALHSAHATVLPSTMLRITSSASTSGTE